MIERFPPNEPREWLNRARSNLIQSQTAAGGVYLEDLCFQAQQAAEKAFKALLLHHDIRFPYIHDLAELIHLLQRGGVAVPDAIQESARLTDYAVEARYPGLSEPVSYDEYRELAGLAESVLQWVEEQLIP